MAPPVDPAARAAYWRQRRGRRAERDHRLVAAAPGPVLVPMSGGRFRPLDRLELDLLVEIRRRAATPAGELVDTVDKLGRPVNLDRASTLQRLGSLAAAGVVAVRLDGGHVLIQLRPPPPAPEVAS